MLGALRVPEGKPILRTPNQTLRTQSAYLCELQTHDSQPIPVIKPKNCRVRLLIVIQTTKTRHVIKEMSAGRCSARKGSGVVQDYLLLLCDQILVPVLYGCWNNFRSQI